MAPSGSAVRIRDPGELFGSLPWLIGFVPVDSVVLISTVGRGGGVGKRLRADLPAGGDVERLAGQLVAAIAADRPLGVIVLVVGGGASGGTDPPGADLVRAVRRGLLARGVEACDGYWAPAVAGGVRWRSFDGSESGLVADPKGTVIAAVYTSLGFVVYGSRGEMERLFTLDDVRVLRRRSALIEAALSQVSGVSGGVAAIRRALRSAAEGSVSIVDADLVRIAVTLSDGAVRDSCLATALPVGGPVAVAAEPVWQALSRALPAPWRADAACLAAFSAYCRGDGAMAQVAIEVALAADSGHLLAQLLRRALEKGIPPARMHRLAAHDEVGLCERLDDAA